jgi:hypothetical protein
MDIYNLLDVCNVTIESIYGCRYSAPRTTYPVCILAQAGLGLSGTAGGDLADVHITRSVDPLHRTVVKTFCSLGAENLGQGNKDKPDDPSWCIGSGAWRSLSRAK